MNLSSRLDAIAKFIPQCSCLADIGTDHGYIPIYAIQNNVCSEAIAGDIKKGPVEIANKNIRSYGLEDKIETRIGPGLSILKNGEADVILIAGMGGNLISTIINENIEIAINAKYLILQPVQYPEELRKFLFKSNFQIIDEELAIEGSKYYHIIKATYGDPKPYEKEVFYYTGLELMIKKHPLIQKYVDYKLNRINVILKELSNSTNITRKDELLILKEEFEEVSIWLKNAEK